MTPSLPKYLIDIPDKEFSSIEGVCFDIDDTFSTDGKITSNAYQSLWKLKDAGYMTVPITGRPAGWCDHIVRFWPVDAIIGENGAFVFYMSDGKRNRLDILNTADKLNSKKQLDDLAKKIKNNFADVSWASDQDYREYDLAIDYCEDVKPWKETKVKKLLEFCKIHGAHAKLSSIHVNAWFGDYDKMSAFKFWMKKNMPGAERKISNLNNWIYIGDSPNDSPAFFYFKKSVGVNNLKKYLPDLEHYPTFLTNAKSGKGFSELVDKLIQSKDLK